MWIEDWLFLSGGAGAVSIVGSIRLDEPALLIAGIYDATLTPEE